MGEDLDPEAHAQLCQPGQIRRRDYVADVLVSFEIKNELCSSAVA
jgi:hypothetical protein